MDERMRSALRGSVSLPFRISYLRFGAFSLCLWRGNAMGGARFWISARRPTIPPDFGVPELAKRKSPMWQRNLITLFGEHSWSSHSRSHTLPMSKLICEICGAGESRSGKAFDSPGLAKHMVMVHGAGSEASHDAGPLVCDICGVNQSSRGKLFTLPSHVLQHKKKRHPEALGLPVPESAKAAGGSVPVSRVRKRIKAAPSATPRPHTQVKFCPHCGFNLEVVHAAMEFVNGDS